MNNFKCKKLIATALTFVIFMALVQQPLLTAKERRGATVVVTMIDGSLVKGELLTVKADALLVYDQDAGQGKSIDLQQVVQVKVLKKSKALLGLAIGLGVGLGFCALNPDMAGHANAGIGQIYIPLMSLSGLGGGLLGAFAGITDKFSLVGASSRNLQQNLKRLKHFAREQDFEKSSPPVSADSISSQPEAQSHGAQQQRQPRHCFRLLWLPGSQFSSGNIDFSAENGTFRFVGGPPAESTTVFQFKLVPQYDLNHLKIGQLRLEYELTPHFSSSLEFFARGESFTDYMYETLSYYSTEHAGRYESTIFVSNNYTYSSLLLGLNWKPFALSFANRNIFELGISVGPALAQVNLDNSYDEDPIRVKKFTTLTWSCKVHAAYDYFYNDNFSLGVFIAYQYLCPSFPNFTFFNEEQPFRPERDFFSDPILRPTEFTVPGRKVQLGGMALGIRVGVHF